MAHFRNFRRLRCLYRAALCRQRLFVRKRPRLPARDRLDSGLVQRRRQSAALFRHERSISKRIQENSLQKTGDDVNRIERRWSHGIG